MLIIRGGSEWKTYMSSLSNSLNVSVTLISQ